MITKAWCGDCGAEFATDAAAYVVHPYRLKSEYQAALATRHQQKVQAHPFYDAPGVPSDAALAQALREVEEIAPDA